MLKLQNANKMCLFSGCLLQNIYNDNAISCVRYIYDAILEIINTIKRSQIVSFANNARHRCGHRWRA